MGNDNGSFLSCIRDPKLWHTQFEVERRQQVKLGRCTTLKRKKGRLSWCQREASLKGGPCDKCLNEHARAAVNRTPQNNERLLGQQTAGAAEDHSGFDPRMAWFYIGMDNASEDTRKTSEFLGD